MTASETSELFLGIMSGTSLDGVDVSAVEFTGNHIQKMVSNYYPYPKDMRETLFALAREPNYSVQSFGETDIALGEFYADAARHLQQSPAYQNTFTNKRITAIGNHGQTVHHQPNGKTPFTLQIGSPHALCRDLQTPVCFDFRRMDMAVGGQGAPLAPLFHQHVIAGDSPIIVINLGGIANVTDLRDKPVACDTGPANTLIDHWTQRHFQQNFDDNGRLGQTGQVNKILLEKLLEHPYLCQPAPKSTGPELFNLQWIETLLPLFPNITPEDVLTTLYYFSVESIAGFISQKSPLEQKRCNIVLAGGGAKNKFLVSLLEKRLQSYGSVMTSNSINIDCDFVEAAAFAWLAMKRWHHLPLDTSCFTGAKRNPIMLGSVILP